MKLKSVLFLVFVGLVVENARCAMTEAQVKSATKIMRNVCQPKTKVSNVQIDSMHKGEFSEDHDMMCYTECILKMAQIMKDGKVDMEAIGSQLDRLPPNFAESAKGALEKCRNMGQSPDKCQAAYEFYKCYYEFNPENFFLP